MQRYEEAGERPGVSGGDTHHCGAGSAGAVGAHEAGMDEDLVRGDSECL